MSFFRRLFRKLFGSSPKKNFWEVKNTAINVDRVPLRARTVEEKALEERVWQAQREYRTRVLKERFAAQREWMSKFEKEEAERIRRKEAAQRI